jgi:hypothetical protein
MWGAGVTTTIMQSKARCSRTTEGGMEGGNDAVIDRTGRLSWTTSKLWSISCPPAVASKHTTDSHTQHAHTWKTCTLAVSTKQKPRLALKRTTTTRTNAAHSCSPKKLLHRKHHTYQPQPTRCTRASVKHSTAQ